MNWSPRKAFSMKHVSEWKTFQEKLMFESGPECGQSHLLATRSYDPEQTIADSLRKSVETLEEHASKMRNLLAKVEAATLLAKFTRQEMRMLHSL